MKKFLRTLVLMAAMLLPFASQAQDLYDFEDNAIPAGWTNSSSYPWVVTNTSQGNGHAGTYCIKSGNSGVSSSESSISVTIDFTMDGSISFLGGIFGEGTSSVWDKCIFMIDGVQQFAYGALGTWSTYTYQVTAGTHTFTWKYTKDSSVNPTGDAFFVDNVVIEGTSIPDCYPVKNLAIDGSLTTSESLTFNWSDTNNSGATYNVYRINGTDTTLLANVSDTSYTIDTLQPNTAYTFGVEADCGVDGPARLVVVSGRTACSSATIDSDNPYVENFDDGYAALSNDYTAPAGYPDHEMPGCWEFLNMSSSTSSYPQAYMSGSTTYAVSGNCLFFKSSQSTPIYSILPVFESTETLQLQFTYRNEGTGTYNGTLSMGYMTDPTDASTFVEMRSCAQTTTKTLEEVTIPAGMIDTVRLAFRYTGGSSDNYYLSIDNVVLRVAPSCMRVENFACIDSITTAHTATFTWVSDAGNFQIEYKKTADTTWMEETVTDTFAVLTGLDATTTYNVRVKALCGGEESDYSVVRNVTTTVACPAPANLRAVLTPGDGTTATLTWSDPTGSAWQICFNGDTNNYIDVTDGTSLTIDTLTPEQAYTAKVRRDCTEEQEGYSTWSSTITFVPTNAYMLTVNDGTATNDYVPIYGYYVDNHIHTRFIIPAADLAQIQFGIIDKLVFHASTSSAAWSGASFQVYMTETAATTVSSVVPTDDMQQVYTGSLSIASNKMEVTFTTPYQYMGGNLMIAFEQPTSGSYTSCTWYGVNATGTSMGGYGTSVSQQNFLPKTTIYYTPGDEPTCFPVNGLAVVDSLTTAESVTLTWVDTANSSASYNVYVISDTDTTLAGTATDTSYTFDELSANTTYTFGVVADCGGDEALMRTVQVTTPCVAIAIDSLPWTEGFESYPASSSSGSANVFNDACWHVLNRYSSNYPYVYNGSYVHSGSKSLCTYSYSSVRTILALPPFEGDLSSLMLTLWQLSGSTSAYMEVGVMSNPDDASTFVSIEQLHNSGTYVYEPFEVTFAGHTSGYIALRYNGSYNSVYIDDLTVTVAPSCQRPQNVSVSDISANEVTITIVDSSETGNYHLVMLRGNDTAVNVIVTDTVVTIDTLMSSSQYTVVVSALCDDGTETSTVSTVFNTSCETATLPWSEDFEAYAAGNLTIPCWQNEHISGGGSQVFKIYTSAMGGNSTHMLQLPDMTNGTMTKLVLPEMELEVGTAYQFSIDIYRNTTSYPDEGVRIFASTNGQIEGATELGFLHRNYQQTDGGVVHAETASAWYTYEFLIPDTIRGLVNIILRGESSYGASTYMDNLSVVVAPDCLRPQEFTIVDSITTAHTATFTWVSDAGNFQMEYKKAVDTSWTVATVTDTFAVLTGLDANTAYNARVKAICSGDESLYSHVINFSTTVSCPAPANLRAVLTPGDGTTATLTWSDPTGSAWQICFNGDTNYIDVTDSASYTFDTLTPEQAYTAKVRRDCTDEQEGYSTWSSTITFVPTDAYSLIVNDGTSTNSYVPIYGTYVDEGIHSRFIIPAADLAQLGFGVINKLVFHASNTSVTWSGATFQVYMTETDATTVSSVVSTTDMEQVYSGSLSIANNKMEVNFTTPYQYMGGNLMIAFEEPTTGSWSSCSWYGISATGASMGGYGSSVSQQNFLPKTTIFFTPGDEPTCFPVTNLMVDESLTTDESITVTWEDTVNSAASYNVYIFDGTDTVAYTTTTTSYTFQNLQPSTIYTILVAANCGSDEAIMRSVVTHTDCAGGGCAITIVATDGYGDGWNGAYIDIVQNGISIAHCSATDQGLEDTPATETFTYQVCSSSPVTFVWHSGEYDDEASFIIKNANDSVLYTVADASSLNNGATFYTATNPCEGAPIIVPDTFYVTLNSANSTMGTVSPAGVTAVADGGSFTATATAATGYHFVSWTDAAGAVVSTANPYTFSVTADVTLIGTFEANSTPTYYTVSVSSADSTMGTVSCTPSGSVEAGTSVTATATPATNHIFTGWVNAAGDTVSTATPYTFTVTADITLVGTFRYNGVGIETVSLDNVSLFPNPASTSVTISGLEAKATVTLVDINGHVSGQWTAKDNTLTIDLTNYATGTYFVRIVGEQAMAVRKLIIK